MESKKEKKDKLKWRYKLLIFLIMIITFFLLWSRYISTSGLVINEYKVTNSMLPESFHGLKIVHLSDIHYGTIIDDKRMTKIIDEVNIINPDIVVFTGDLIDKSVKLTTTMKKTLVEKLSQIKTKYGKYAISGNHDYRFSSYASILDESQFINLNNNYDLIYNEKYDYLFIGGLESEIEGKPDISKVTNYLVKDDESKARAATTYKILIMHTPDTFDKIKSFNFDLVLAGHSHNGQIRLPFVGALFTPVGAKNYYEPYYQIGKTDFYISGGLGTSEINLRFFNKPSFNFYRIIKK